MATKTQAQTPETQSPVHEPTLDLSSLQAQRKQLGEQIKAAKAAMPKQTALETELARQATAGRRNGFVGPFYAKLVAQRINLGVPADEALEQVQALWREWTLAALADLAPADAK
jgi:hypothetical protein